MLDLDWRVHEVDDATLVGAVVESSAPTPRRVWIESALDGPVWPPRRDGVPERGWDGDRFEGVVPAGGRLALGFASPAAPTEPPLFVVDHERASAAAVADEDALTDEDGDASPDEVTVPRQTPDGVLRALGSPRPPRDAVPGPDDPAGGVEPIDLAEPTDAEPDDPTESTETRPTGPDDQVDERPAPTGGWTDAAATTSPDETTDGDREPRPASRDACVDGVPDGAGEPPVPEEVDDWLSAVEARVRRAEALADARRVTAAARELQRVGGVDGAERLVATLPRDERALRAVARRARRLADRCADPDVPLSTLGEL